ncbi:DUF305 domain-containing protein [Microbacterium aurum]|uniref:DUF305 domain-containing protein n=1 Tax=Microbacterium aurum TaxID=36805 RepID=UPI0028E84343|nr:DUF305 domain-containing protein [Microbacterium aurum]
MTDPDGDRRALPPWWAVLLVVVAVAGVAFAIGRFSTFGALGAGTVPTSDSPEAGFARDMQVHHGQAVEMAMDIYRTTENPDVRVLAYDIATTQSAQKGEFYDWLVKWNLPQSGGPLMAWMTDAADTAHQHVATPGASEAELLTQMGMASPAELAAMRAETGTAADCTFLALMIRHHEGALPMAQALLQLGSEPRALQVAQGVIDTQSAEIDLMTSLRRGMACTD